MEAVIYQLIFKECNCLRTVTCISVQMLDFWTFPHGSQWVSLWGTIQAGDWLEVFNLERAFWYQCWRRSIEWVWEKIQGNQFQNLSKELEMVAGGQKWRNGCGNHLGGIIYGIGDIWNWVMYEFDSQNSDWATVEDKTVTREREKDVVMSVVCLSGLLVDWLALFN